MTRPQAAYVCSCGDREPHVTAHRTTADGLGIEIWSDGAVTGRMGFKLKDVPIVRPRTADATELAVRAAHLFAGEACLHDSDELGDLYRASRWAAERGGDPGAVRQRLAQLQKATFAPTWIITSTDRDDTPTERVWRLPRLRWPGVVVFDHVNHGRHGRYEITTAVPGTRDTVASTGLHFRTQAELVNFLLNEWR